MSLRRLLRRCAILDQLCELISVDVENKAEDRRALWDARRGSKEIDVVPQRMTKVVDCKTVFLVNVREVNPLFGSEGINKAVPGETCCSAIGVVYDYDVLDTEKVLPYRD